MSNMVVGKKNAPYKYSGDRGSNPRFDLWIFQIYVFLPLGSSAVKKPTRFGYILKRISFVTYSIKKAPVINKE